jgi:hypothetical protein
MNVCKNAGGNISNLNIAMNFTQFANSKTNGQILYEQSEVVGFTLKNNDPVLI